MVQVKLAYRVVGSTEAPITAHLWCRVLIQSGFSQSQSKPHAQDDEDHQLSGLVVEFSLWFWKVEDSISSRVITRTIKRRIPQKQLLLPAALSGDGGSNAEDRFNIPCDVAITGTWRRWRSPGFWMDTGEPIGDNTLAWSPPKANHTDQRMPRCLDGVMKNPHDWVDWFPEGSVVAALPLGRPRPSLSDPDREHPTFHPSKLSTVGSLQTTCRCPTALDLSGGQTEEKVATFSRRRRCRCSGFNSRGGKETGTNILWRCSS